ncbi:MAG TPA: biliverdin-producing heme oxygenase [Devosia sp.]|jgi:heme oxygenase|nr:biliverdin-producing heme oxygenase [Devosia sp.]
MDAGNLRSVLRQQTGDLHARLDELVGGFDTLAAYRRYLVGLYRFRHALETAIPDLADWSVQGVAPLIRQDMTDLGIGSVEMAPGWTIDCSRSSVLGTAYVLEGSAVGARLLYRRAAQLGLHATHGARHLAAQTGDVERWRRYLHVLEAGSANPAAAIAAARSAFMLALTLFAEPVREPV